ncbi:DUF3223 domain-containing protein [Pseudomonas sp. R32]|uniref:DUF3223 domain-containing protein n=1 Tax=Pseudomonas sp. R32 TaxID=1573704 RepID=UPI00132EAA2B|nr:hypothetical protein PspR32_13370 [Pseudomonas sp. R32]
MFWLGPFEYKSKKELLDRLKDYLQNAPIGVITSKLAFKKMHLLMAMHPEASRKIGVGVDHFKIVRNELGTGRGIKLVRTDGCETQLNRMIILAVGSRRPSSLRAPTVHRTTRWNRRSATRISCPSSPQLTAAVRPVLGVLVRTRCDDDGIPLVPSAIRRLDGYSCSPAWLSSIHLARPEGCGPGGESP